MALKYDPNVLQQALAAASGFGATPLENKALVEAGLVESGLTHLTGGDRDSTGFLQQRPSQGWGPVGESVSKDTLQFLRAARKLRKGGFKGSAGELAQAVQRSAFPARYDQRAQDAVKLLQGAGASSPRPGAVAASADGAPADQQGLGAAVATLLAAGQKPQIASAGIAAPAFSARAAMPQGAQLPQGGGGPAAPGANVDQLLSLAAAQGQQAAPGSPAATASGDAPRDVQTQLARAAAIDAKKLPYKWGGGHGGRVDPSKPQPLDCSGAVSAVLGIDPRVASQFKAFGSPGDGGDKGTTIYAKDSHVLMKIDGHFFGTSKTNPGGGAGWIPRSAISPEYLKGFTVRHVGG